MLKYIRRICTGAALTLVAMVAGVGDGLAQEPTKNAASSFPGSWYRNEVRKDQACKQCGCLGCYARPYETSSCLYGYQDYVYGRGPLINLGGASLEPGFRGYGVIGSPGHGLGLRPNSWIDAAANNRGWKLIH